MSMQTFNVDNISLFIDDDLKYRELNVAEFANILNSETNDVISGLIDLYYRMDKKYYFLKTSKLNSVFLDFVINQINHKLKQEERVYIEMPAKHTYNLPTNQSFKEHAINLHTINFYDDASHLQTYDINEVFQMFCKVGKYSILESGSIQNEFLQDILLNVGFANKNAAVTTLGLWSKFKWCSYMILEKM